MICGNVYFVPYVPLLHYVGLITFQRSRSKFKVKTAGIKIIHLQSPDHPFGRGIVPGPSLRYTNLRTPASSSSPTSHYAPEASLSRIVWPPAEHRRCRSTLLRDSHTGDYIVDDVGEKCARFLLTSSMSASNVSGCRTGRNTQRRKMGSIFVESILSHRLHRRVRGPGKT